MNSLITSQHNRLIEKVHALAVELPNELVEELAVRLLVANGEEPSEWSLAVINAVPNPRVREEVEELLALWREHMPDIGADTLAFSLLTAAHTAQQHRETQSIELVWTGTQSQVLPLRRTDQALLQLIKEAQQRLLVVSFAVYKVRNIVDALIEAAREGVEISILLESSDESEGKLTFDAMKAMGAEIRKQARFYTWPSKNRPLSPVGKHGILHAKAAVADGRVLFISSANLTEYAMHLNMELGVLIRGGELPKQVDAHFDEMMMNQELIRFRNSSGN